MRHLRRSSTGLRLQPYGLLEWLSAAKLADLETDERISTAIDRMRWTRVFSWKPTCTSGCTRTCGTTDFTALGYGRLQEWDAEKQGDSFGKFRTGVVGEIDMLLRTPDGDIVVIELKRRADDQTVGQICRYYGWVKEHLCPPNKRVFGLILAKEISESLRYALKAVGSDIRVRHLQFDVRLGAAWP